MENAGDFPALEVNGEAISLHDLLAAAKFRGQLDFVREAVDAALIRAAAARMQLEISDDELQAEADAFRSRHDLYEAAKTLEWLAAQRLSQEDWELQLEDGILRRKLRHAVSAGKVDQYFAENKRSWDAATISQILVTDEGMARELRAQAVEDEADFHELARQYSIDNATRRTGAHMDRRRRRDLDPILASAIFGVPAGEVAGSVRTDLGWHVIRVESHHPAQLDDETRESIADVLFLEWLDGERSKAQVQTFILDLC